jgi:hypothetical protein
MVNQKYFLFVPSSLFTLSTNLALKRTKVPKRLEDDYGRESLAKSKSFI